MGIQWNYSSLQPDPGSNERLSVAPFVPRRLWCEIGKGS
jgi:hypothetical protein